jgi:hypothetical protein
LEGMVWPPLLALHLMSPTHKRKAELNIQH